MTFFCLFQSKTHQQQQREQRQQGGGQLQQQQLPPKTKGKKGGKNSNGQANAAFEAGELEARIEGEHRQMHGSALPAIRRDSSGSYASVVESDRGGGNYLSITIGSEEPQLQVILFFYPDKKAPWPNIYQLGSLKIRRSTNSTKFKTVDWETECRSEPLIYGFLRLLNCEMFSWVSPRTLDFLRCSDRHFTLFSL